LHFVGVFNKLDLPDYILEREVEWWPVYIRPRPALLYDFTGGGVVGQSEAQAQACDGKRASSKAVLQVGTGTGASKRASEAKGKRRAGESRGYSL
jgi:hypothetical protein